MEVLDASVSAARIGEEEGPSANIESVAALPDGTIVAVSRDAVMHLWGPDGSKVRKLKVGSTVDPHPIAVAPDGSLIACGGNGLTMWSAKTRTKVYKLKTGWLPAFSPDGATVAIVSRNDVFTAVAETGESLRAVDAEWKRGAPVSAAVHSIAFSPKGDQLATGGEFGRVRFFDLTKRKLLREEQLLPLPAGPVYAVAWSKSGQLACAGHGTSHYLRAKDRKLLELSCVDWLGAEWPAAPDHAQSDAICFSPDGSRVLSTFSARRSIPGKASWATLWESDTGRPLARLVFQKAEARAATFTSDGRAVLGTSEGVWTWDSAR